MWYSLVVELVFASLTSDVYVSTFRTEIILSPPLEANCSTKIARRSFLLMSNNSITIKPTSPDFELDMLISNRTGLEI